METESRNHKIRETLLPSRGAVEVQRCRDVFGVRPVFSLDPDPKKRRHRKHSAVKELCLVRNSTKVDVMAIEFYEPVPLISFSMEIPSNVPRVAVPNRRDRFVCAGAARQVDLRATTAGI